MLITWNTVASSVGTAGTSCQMHWCHITAVSQNKNLISWIRLLLYRSSGVFTQVQREREKKKIYSLNKCRTAYCISIIIVCTHKKKLTFWYFPGFIISWSLLKNGKHQILKRDLVGEGENVCVFFPAFQGSLVAEILNINSAQIQHIWEIFHLAYQVARIQNCQNTLHKLLIKLNFTPRWQRTHTASCRMLMG